MLSSVKFIGLFFLVFLLVTLQVSLPFFPNQLSLVFVLVIVLFLVNASPWAWLTAIIGGLFLDLYSIFPPALFCLSLICSLAIVHKIVHKFNITSEGRFFVLGLWSALIYKINILFFSSLLYFLGFSNHLIILNKFYWLDLIWFIILNASFIFVIILSIRIIKKRVY